MEFQIWQTSCIRHSSFVISLSTLDCVLVITFATSRIRHYIIDIFCSTLFAQRYLLEAVLDTTCSKSRVLHIFSMTATSSLNALKVA